MKKSLSILMVLALVCALMPAFAFGEAADPYGKDFAGYPIQTEETLRVWIGNGIEKNDEYTDYNQWPFFQFMEEATGVKVDYASPVAGADANQAFNLLLASDNLPDIIYMSSLPAKVENLINDGYLCTLDAYMETYAPALYSRLTADEITLKSLKSDSGHFYAFPFLREDVSYLGTFIGIAVNTKLLDEVNMEMPVTIADWDAYLRAIKDICGVPIGGNSYGRLKGLFANAYGFNGMDTYYVEDGEVKTWMNAEGLKDMLAQLHAWMADGLIDPDIITINGSTFYQKVVAQVYGAAWQGSGAVSGYITGVTERDGGFYYDAAQYPVMNEGDEIRFLQGEAAWIGNGAFITTSCKNVPLAMRWLDYSYTEEGINLWNYGKQGVSYEIGEDGLPYYTDLITKANEPLRDATGRYVGINGNGWSVMEVYFDQIRNPAKSTEFAKVWTENTQNALKYRLPVLISTDAEAVELADIENALTTYAGEMFTAFLLGSESLDNFDQYLEHLDEMDIDRVLEIKQAQYDRFIGR